MKITPLFDRVLLKTVKEKNTSTLVLPENANKSHLSEVVAIGKDVKSVRVSDKVLINKYAASEFDLNNETLLLIKECDVLAIIEGEK